MGRIFLGLIGFVAALALLMIGTSLFADFRTENIAGPGVDIRVIDRYPPPNSEFRFELTARGGSAAGIRTVKAVKNGVVLATAEGEGVTWGSTVTSKTRGADQAVLAVPVRDVSEEGGISFTVGVSYVCAMSEGSGYFNNQNFSDSVTIELPAQRSSNQLIDGLIAAAILMVWVVAWLFGLRVFHRLEAHNPSFDDDEGYPLIGLYMFGVLLGHYVFSQFLVSIFGIGSDVALYAITVLWAAIPLIVFWRIRNEFS